MNQFDSSTPDYTMGFSEEMLNALARFTAESNARHLLPYLRPGLRVLDFGCGPGTISVGLARAVHPGELHGVDMDARSVEMARSVAQSQRQDNAFFHVADLVDLPFEDGSFDVAHCHNVLMHFPDTHAVLTEIFRILRSGGVISCKELIGESSFNHPNFGVLRKAWEMFEDLVIADDGHPQMGKDMKGHLVRAGFAGVAMEGSFQFYNSPADIEWIFGFAKKWFLSPEITEAAIRYGAATRELCDSIAGAYEMWRDDPGAVCGIAYGEALASKP